MENPTIGFIGFGEAAYSISNGLIEEGVNQIAAYDVCASDPKLGAIIRNRVQELNVDLKSSLNSLIEDSEIIFCATSAKYALSIAMEVAPLLRDKQIYVDMNASSPMSMKEIALLFQDTSASFVDAAVMEPVPPHRHKVPILLSGTGARRLETIVNQFGMNVKFISDDAGASSAIKMVRSVFVKGFTMLLLETLSAAQKFNVNGEILESINRTLTDKPLKTTANLLLTRSVKHAERRVAEMKEVLNTLSDIHVDDTMSAATEKKYQILNDPRLREKFEKADPERYEELITALEML